MQHPSTIYILLLTENMYLAFQNFIKFASVSKQRQKEDAVLNATFSTFDVEQFYHLVQRNQW